MLLPVLLKSAPSVAKPILAVFRGRWRKAMLGVVMDFAILWVLEAALAVRGHHSCVDPRGCTGAQGSSLLYGSKGLYWGSGVITPVWIHGAVLAVKGHHSCGSKALYWRSRVTTPMWIQGAVLAVKGHHSCVDPRGCTGGQGPSLLYGSKGLYGGQGPVPL